MFGSLRILEQGTDATVMRQKVLANNIANVDVPNFKRSELNFESELKRAIEAKSYLKSAQHLPLRRSHPLHIDQASLRGPKAHEVKPQVRTDYLSTMRNDGNNVDIEEEVSKLVRNQLQYTLFMDRISSKFRKWNMFIRPA